MNLKMRNTFLIIIIVCLISLFGVSFGYFALYVTSDAVTNTGIVSNFDKGLTFIPGEPLNLLVTVDNFAEGGDNVFTTTTSTVIINTDETEVDLTENYSVSFLISNNEFVYSKDVNTPEIILEIFDYDGHTITSIPGLEYVTVTDSVTNEVIAGFDITTKSGTFNINDSVSISTTYPDINSHEWNVKITYINLDVNQAINSGNKLESELLFSNN